MLCVGRVLRLPHVAIVIYRTVHLLVPPVSSTAMTWTSPTSGSACIGHLMFVTTPVPQGAYGPAWHVQATVVI